MTFGERLLFLIGIVLAIVGFMFFAVGLGMIFDPEDELSNTLVALLLGGIPLAGGTMLCIRLKKNAKARDGEQVERQILELAKANDGKLTVAEVAMKMTLTSAKAKELLDTCHADGLADISVSDKGAVVYQFYGVS